MPALILKCLYSGTLGTSPASLYTVPTGKTCLIKNITLANKTATNCTVTVWTRANNVNYQFSPLNYVLRAGHRLCIEEDVYLGQTSGVMDAIQASAQFASAVDVRINGVEEA